MKSELFMKGDVESILRSLVATAFSDDSLHVSPHAAAERKGYSRAIVGVAIAFGIDPAVIGRVVCSDQLNGGVRITTTGRKLSV